MTRIVIGTMSPDKAREIREILSGAPVAFADLGDFPSAPRVEEDQPTFLGNARKKALETARALGERVLADDSGLEVDALGGAPGVLSHRWAGLPPDDRENNLKLIRMLQGVAPRRRAARYRCAVALASPSGVEAEAEGACEGTITEAPRGSSGFGYDPFFLSADLGRTFAEAAPEEKHRVSHRGRALRTLRERVWISR